MPHELPPSRRVKRSQRLQIPLRIRERHIVNDNLKKGIDHPGQEHMFQPAVNLRHGMAERLQCLAVLIDRRSFQHSQLVDDMGIGRSVGALEDQMERIPARVHIQKKRLHAVFPGVAHPQDLRLLL